MSRDKNPVKKTYWEGLANRLFGIGLGMIFANGLLMYFDYSQAIKANVSLVALVPLLVGLILTIKYGKRR